MDHDTNAAALSFSLVESGASGRILERVVRIPVRDPRGCLRLALVLAAFTWGPLVVLSTVQGLAFRGYVDEPFFGDITPHIRFLFALPLLILADLIVGPNIVRVAGQFVASGLVPDRCLPQFENAIDAAVKLRDSNLTELIILAIAYITTAYNINREIATGVSSWLAIGGTSAHNFTLTGWWYVLLSVPVYQFFVFRWVIRLVIWMVFLFRVSRLDLEIIPTHPDGAAGLGFVGQALAPTSVIILAASSVLCSSVGTQVLYRQADLQEFVPAFLIFVVVAVIAFVAPFAVFIPTLAFARRDGLVKYGSLATRYTQLFDTKWVKAQRAATRDELLGTEDIQSLADIGNSFDRIANMKLFPIELADLRALLIAALFPAIPLVLTQIPLKDVARILAKVLV